MEPLSPFEAEGTSYEPQRQEWDALLALLTSLDADQRSTAELSTPRDVLLLGPESEDWAFPSQAEGIPVSALTSEQRDLLLHAISRYVNDISDAEAESIMATYEDQLDDTYLSFSGSPSLTDTGDYVRIDVPSAWIEFVMDPAYSTDEPHPHSVWRDKVSDYGGTRG